MEIKQFIEKYSLNELSELIHTKSYILKKQDMESRGAIRVG